MSKKKLARILITLPTLVYGFVPPFVDFSSTHVFHSAWTPHARFHMVWLVATNTGIALIALCLLWSKTILDFGNDLVLKIKIAALLGFCALGGFFFAVMVLPFYPGSLADSNGVPDIMGIDANLLVFLPSLICLLTGFLLSVTTRTQSDQ